MLKMILNVHKSGLEKNCNPKTVWAIERKFGVLEKLILLFHRDKCNWNLFCPWYFTFFFFKNSNRRKHYLMQISSYQTKILTISLVTAKIGSYCICLEWTKWLKIYDIFSIIFYSTLITRKRLMDLKFSTLVEQPNCVRKFNNFNLTNLFIDLVMKILWMIFFISA